MGVIAVKPDQLLRLEHLGVDRAAVDGGEGQGLEAEHLLLRAVDLARNDQDQILDPDAVLAGLVVARLIREDHPGLQRLVAAALAAPDRRDALRTLVNREEAADAVAGAMGV